MRREGLILETIQQLEDIPYVPQLLGYDFGRELFERDYMFIEKLSGVALHDIKEKLTPENLQEIEYQVGQYIARLGQVNGKSFGYPGHGPGHDSNSWRSAFVAMMKAVLNDGESLEAPLPVSYNVLREIIHQHAYALEEIKEPALVHWDLWAGNVFVTPQNGKYVLEGIIDWERALWGDPDVETAVACRFYGPAFFDGYGKQLAEQGNEAIRQSLYRLYLWALLLIEIRVRHYEPDYLPWARDQLQKDVNFLRAN
jgi:fructosamine-3-kinase